MSVPKHLQGIYMFLLKRNYTVLETLEDLRPWVSRSINHASRLMKQTRDMVEFLETYGVKE